MNEFIETAMNGRVVSEIVLGQRKFDLVVRLDDEYREDPEQASPPVARSAGRRPRAARLRWPRFTRRADRTRSIAKTCGGASSSSATRPAAT